MSDLTNTDERTIVELITQLENGAPLTHRDRMNAAQLLRYAAKKLKAARSGGRSRIHSDAAARQKAYRARKRQSAGSNF